MSKVTLSGRKPVAGWERGPAPAPIEPDTGMHSDYWVLSDDERAKGFIRPVRRSYKHLKCGTITTMNLIIAQTYAREPHFYGATYCAGCRAHFPVGDEGQFEWDDGSGQKVGT